MAGSPLLVVAGEASGDQRAGGLVERLIARRPALQPFGMGGEEMRRAGVRILAESEAISVVGLVEALRVLPRARQIFRLLLGEVERRDCRHAILVDFPGFNLRLARALRRRGVRVLYYVSPQVWAWRRRRIHLIRRVVDRMLVLFPFEAEFYRKHGVEVLCVGHPLVDETPSLTQAWARQGDQPPPYRIALLPGSRISEVEGLLPLQLQAVEIMAKRIPVDARVIVAPGFDPEMVTRHLASVRIPVRTVTRERYEAIAGSHLALCASGTATLETGLLGTPLIVLYRMTPWTYRLARRLVRLPYISLVNLVLERPAVPELIQEQATPERIAETALELLRQPARVAEMRQDLAELRTRLGESGASDRAAAAADDWLRETAA